MIAEPHTKINEFRSWKVKKKWGASCRYWDGASYRVWNKLINILVHCKGPLSSPATRAVLEQVPDLYAAAHVALWSQVCTPLVLWGANCRARVTWFLSFSFSSHGSLMMTSVSLHSPSTFIVVVLARSTVEKIIFTSGPLEFFIKNYLYSKVLFDLISWFSLFKVSNWHSAWYLNPSGRRGGCSRRKWWLRCQDRRSGFLCRPRQSDLASPCTSFPTSRLGDCSTCLTDGLCHRASTQ